MKPEIIFQTPAWYFLLCLAAGFAFALFTYFRSSVFKNKPKLFLSVIRGILAFLVAFLLLNPLIKTVSNTIIKPKVVLVLDNSKSMLFAGNKAIEELKKGIIALKASVEEKGFELEIHDLKEKKENIQETKFSLAKTNLSETLNDLKNNFEGQNLSDVILVSDGIINDGVSPSFQKYPFNVHSVGFGDTTSKKDLIISGISANKLAYLGNKFTVNVDVSAYLLPGKSTSVLIKNGAGIVLASKTLSVTKKEDFQTFSFDLSADKVGKQRYIAEIQTVAGEYSVKNNRKEFVVDVVNGKEKVLLLAFSPHPDIKAIKNIIEQNDLFELQIQILQSTDPSQIAKILLMS